MSSDIENYNNTGFLDQDSAWETLKYYGGNLIDVIAAQRGWKPLEVYQEMTVTYADNRRYVICRLKDEET